MAPEQWARIKEVLASALEQPEEQRTAFLDNACGSDRELRREVESLLAAEPDSSLRSPVAGILGEQPPDTHIARRLAPGQALGPYRIDAKLGEGGMGVVYKARDTRLDRFVALKVLPPGKLADSDRKRRFIQEAKAASALNHPNIITIHDIAQADGVDFLVMEYLPGKTLDQMIPRKGLRLQEALKYAVEIAGAIAAAHAAGIVHRDIKPTNIMVTGKGTIKVLDFGLAKLTETQAPGEVEPTRTLEPSTEEGAILGTVAYMSPEQAQGKKVDARSDIFSVGAVLYEMVTGRRAFQEDNPISTLAAIVKDEPKPICELVEGIPRELERLIAHCLRKDPERRFQHMDDVRSLIEALKEEAESGQFAAQPSTTSLPRKKLVWPLALAGLLGLTASLFWLLRPTSQKEELKVVPLTTYPGVECCPSFSPDGSQLAFAWNGEKQDNYDIYVQVIGSGRPLRLTTNPALEWSPVWSPNGRYIAFLRFVPGSVSVVLISPLPGGSERVLRVADVPLDQRLPSAVRQLSSGQPEASPAGSQLAWTPDSRWLICPYRNPGEEGWGMYLLSVESGEIRRLTTPPKSMGDKWPAVSPDGKTFVFVRGSVIIGGFSELYRLALSDDLGPRGEPTRLTFEEQFTITPAWTEDGRGLIYSSGQTGFNRSLWRIRASTPASTGQRGHGTADRLLFAGENVHSPAVSRSGRSLVYSQDVTDTNIWYANLNDALQASGSRLLISSSRSDRNAQFSPDGRRIVFISDRAGRNEVWVCDRDGFGAEQLTSMNAPITGCPRWSPDGEKIVFDSNPEGQFEVYVISSKGGRPRRLTSDPADDALGSWSRDGKWIYFASIRTGRWQVWKMPAEGRPAVQLTRNGGGVALESPDGRFVYYSMDNAAVSSLSRVPVDGGEETKILDAVPARSFTVAEKGIFFASPWNQGRSAIQFFEFASRQTRPVLVSEKPVGGVTVSPDGRSILYNQVDQQGSDLMLVENFR